MRSLRRHWKKVHLAIYLTTLNSVESPQNIWQRKGWKKKKEKFKLFLITDNAGINRFCLGVTMFTVLSRSFPLCVTERRSMMNFERSYLFVCWEIRSIIVRKKRANCPWNKRLLRNIARRRDLVQLTSRASPPIKTRLIISWPSGTATWIKKKHKHSVEILIKDISNGMLLK